jgi:sorbitol-specific phosphotransferase system component IIC
MHVYLLTIHVPITRYITVVFVDHFIINGANQALIPSVGLLPCDGVCCITCPMLNTFFSLSSYHRQRPQAFLNCFFDHTA